VPVAKIEVAGGLRTAKGAAALQSVEMEAATVLGASGCVILEGDTSMRLECARRPSSALLSQFVREVQVKPGVLAVTPLR
jgi:hypothetical protein